MFQNPPKILAHSSALCNGNFAVPEYILNKGENIVNLFHRYCPHRMYPLAEVGNSINEITCKFHNFQWSSQGIPINNDRKINCGTAKIGKSSLIFKNFVEPDHEWVKDVSNEIDLVYSHTVEGKSNGSWLWIMDIQADLLHIWKDGIHPVLASTTDLDVIKMEQGDGWVLQTHTTGWWLFIFPFTFIEWSPGCLGINYTTPTDINNEFGFTWNTQFYYSPEISKDRRKEFETLEDAFKEDISAIELQKGKYFPITTPCSRLEDHCFYFGQWISKNRLK